MVTRRVFSKSVTSKLHILFKTIIAGSLKTLKVTRISALYTNFCLPLEGQEVVNLGAGVVVLVGIISFFLH